MQYYWDGERKSVEERREREREENEFIYPELREIKRFAVRPGVCSIFMEIINGSSPPPPPRALPKRVPDTEIP